jgi:predicted DNA-binding protein (MmcQ/YjbR family)
MKKNTRHDAVLEELRAFGLKYPGAHYKSPWPDHMDLAVNDKTFVYLSREGQPFGLSCKLPHSRSKALRLPFASPTEYGLGKSGWVTAQFPLSQQPPLDLLKRWIDESYRAQAPKKLIAQLDAAGTAVPKRPSERAKGSAPRAPRVKMRKRRGE